MSTPGSIGCVTSLPSCDGLLGRALPSRLLELEHEAAKKRVQLLLLAGRSAGGDQRLLGSLSRPADSTTPSWPASRDARRRRRDGRSDPRGLDEARPPRSTVKDDWSSLRSRARSAPASSPADRRTGPGATQEAEHVPFLIAKPVHGERVVKRPLEPSRQAALMRVDDALDPDVEVRRCPGCQAGLAASDRQWSCSSVFSTVIFLTERGLTSRVFTAAFHSSSTWRYFTSKGERRCSRFDSQTQNARSARRARRAPAAGARPGRPGA